MKKRFIDLSLGLAAVAGVAFLTPVPNDVNAGTEPSPFQPEINQLYAVSNVLHSADYRVGKSIAHPPDPCVPPEPCNSPDLNGAVNKMEAINKQVSSVDDMVDSMINEVMGFEPSPFRDDLIPALEVVRDAAGLIAYRVNAYSPPPDDGIPAAFLDALGDVANKASDVVETAQWGIDEFEIYCPCFEDSEWNRIWNEWPAVDVSNQCAEFPDAYSFELGHWVFGDDTAREFIAVLDSPNPTACRAQYGDPSDSHDVPITSVQVEYCVEMMRVKADEAGVTCY